MPFQCTRIVDIAMFSCGQPRRLDVNAAYVGSRSKCDWMTSRHVLSTRPLGDRILLVERRRQLVSRADIVDRLWGAGVFIDVETGVHTAVRKIPQALGDSITTPAFVETVPGKGYRFVANVEVVSSTPGPGMAARRLEPSPARDLANGGTSAGFPGHESTTAAASSTRVAANLLPASTSQLRSANSARLVIGVVAVAMMTGYGAWTWLSGGAPASRVTLAVLPFEYLGSDPDREYLAAGLTEETSASLAQIDLERLIVKGRTLGYRGTAKTALQIGHELSVDYLVESHDSSGGRPAARDRHAHSCARSGACLVAVFTIASRPASWGYNRN